MGVGAALKAQGVEGEAERGLDAVLGVEEGKGMRVDTGKAQAGAEAGAEEGGVLRALPSCPERRGRFWSSRGMRVLCLSPS